MVYDVAPGDVIRIGDGVRLTIVAVEGNLVRFGIESPDTKCSDAGPHRQQAQPKQASWEGK
jgi:hypothetical protein